jgi:hypothetical protein
VAASLPSASHGPILPKIFNALLLRRDFYAAVAADPYATGPAGAIVSLTALARESPAIYEFAQQHSLWGLAALIVVFMACAGWLAYGALAYLITRLVMPSPVEFKRVLRCMGYAETVTAMRLLALLVDPILYTPLHVVLLAWNLLAVVVATRAATQTEGVRLWACALPCFVAQQAVLAVVRMLTY